MVNIIHLNTLLGMTIMVLFRPYLWFSQMIGYINKFDDNKIAMSLMIKDKQLLKNYNKIWKKNRKINENRL